ncbi:MAG: lysylphosphatidylglycerol synthase transmembrane domain-containing protein [Agathobacter sp.]|uniref:lysylphosphatidylglycerol synthase transmembrane domain-containing protein n=1 Tax=Agathobacter sp. TaxID=2021311 RepID=UPI002E790879|nr:lysylphosphatidylglycerol synthase transmembrane domain-containing protein [Agathobacter sp.]MEE1218142.1 lysylphosphatidylglycerol synthase transmembrane domain-containing protein [Agathobacter sp.]
MDKKKIFWAIASVFIAALSIWAVISQSRNFSFATLKSFISGADKGWLLASFVCTFGFIWFEGFALVRIARHFGYKTNALDGTVYGGADVYFSAITPSASGGQPASAYFMMKDGIPGYATTVALLINLVMYTLALLTVGIVSIIFKYPMLKNFSVLSRFFIGIGIVVLIFLALVFYMLLRKGKILYGICDAVIGLMEKIHVIRHGDKLRKKLKNTMAEYQECSNSITGKTGFLAEIFFWNLMQRMSQLLVSFMIFMSMGEGVKKAVDVSVIQCFVAMGSNCVPIPGAMGVADYIMIDGFKQLVGDNAANMELLCRGVTFYGSVLTSAFIILIGYILRRVRKK